MRAFSIFMLIGGSYILRYLLSCKAPNDFSVFLTLLALLAVAAKSCNTVRSGQSTSVLLYKLSRHPSSVLCQAERTLSASDKIESIPSPGSSLVFSKNHQLPFSSTENGSFGTPLLIRHLIKYLYDYRAHVQINGYTCINSLLVKSV